MQNCGKVKLGDVCTIKYGKDHKKLGDGSVPAYGTGGIFRCVDQSIHDKKSVLIPRKGTLSNLFLVDPPFWTVDTLFWTDINLSLVDPDYLYYNLKTKKLEDLNVGTAVPSLTTSIINEVEIELPTLLKQKEIAKTLKCLDNKIEINRKINFNIENQIATIYKSWFVDFEPFVNYDFQQTEFGRIPMGWRYVQLGDICNSVSLTHKKDKDELVFLNTGDIDEGKFLHSKYTKVGELPGQAKKTIDSGDILYSEIRPINKHYAFVTFPSGDYVVSTKLMVIRVKNFNARRLYQFLTSKDVIDELQMQAESRSGTFPQIRFDNISKLQILVATEDVERKYCDMIGCKYELIDKNNEENQKLAELRDTLLPKLMSGELDISEIII